MTSIINWLTSNDARTFYLLMGISLVINRLPYIGVFFRTLNTLLHESGHALMSILTSGEVVRIDINNDTSGIAQTKSSNKFKAFLTSFSGYPFAALCGSLFITMAINDQHKVVAFILLSIVLLNLMLFVRNLFGIIWLILFSALLVSFLVYAEDQLLQFFILFISMIAATEAFSSTMVITFLGLANPRKAGDLTNMQKSSGIPAAFWALVNCAAVLWVLYYTMVHYFPGIDRALI
jgi:hypothetical protein